jgi:hypothetical protein
MLNVVILSVLEREYLCLGFKSSQSLQDILDEFSRLAELDTKRRCYYEDMRSRQCLEKAFKDSKLGLELDLSGRDLTRVYFKERLAFSRRIDLSRNKLVPML